LSDNEVFCRFVRLHDNRGVIPMDVYRAIKTMRAVRQYTDQSVDDAIVTRILEAGRWSGSSKNATQSRLFYTHY